MHEMIFIALFQPFGVSEFAVLLWLLIHHVGLANGRAHFGDDSLTGKQFLMQKYGGRCMPSCLLVFRGVKMPFEKTKRRHAKR